MVEGCVLKNVDPLVFSTGSDVQSFERLSANSHEMRAFN